MAVTDVGIDLGTSSILVYVRGRGVVLKEPSVAAYDRDEDKIRAIGEEARIQLSRAAGNLTQIQPLENGIIADYVVTEQMLRYFIQKAVGRLSFRKPRVSICVPVGLTQVERQAVEDAAYQAGARDVHMVEEPVAAAIGAGIDFSKPCGNMIVDIGGGSTNVAILSMDGIVVSTHVKVGGNDYDEAIIRYIRNQLGVVIEKAAAEEIKMQVGTVYERPEERFLEFIGRDIETGLPKKVKISSEDCRLACRELTGRVVEAVHSVLEKTPPELASDVVSREKPYIARYARLFCLAHSKENPAQSVQVIYIQFLTRPARIAGLAGQQKLPETALADRAGGESSCPILKRGYGNSQGICRTHHFQERRKRVYRSEAVGS